MLDPTRLQALFEILKQIHSIQKPDELWRQVLERSCALLQAEGGSFFVVTPDGRMTLAAAAGVDEEKLRCVPMRVGAGICGWAAEHQQPALIEDARSDPRFNPIADQITGLVTRSILCIPIFSQGKTHGVLELINGKDGRFNEADQEFMTVLGQQTAIAFQNLLLVQEMSQTKELLESLLLNMSGGLIAMDAHGNITVLNPSARKLLELSASSAVGKPAAAILMDYPQLFNLLRTTLSGGAPVSRQEATFEIRGASARFGYSTILISDARKQLLGSGVIFQKLD